MNKNPNPKLLALPTPRLFVTPDDFEGWLRQENIKPVNLEMVPEDLCKSLKKQPQGFVVLTGPTQPRLIQIMDTAEEIKPFDFGDGPMLAGQMVVVEKLIAA